MGHLIPAGTGFATHRNISVVQLGEAVGAPVVEVPMEPVAV